MGKRAAQTRPVTLTFRGSRETKDDSVHATKEAALAAEGTVQELTYTFYFYNTKGWSDVRIWTWGAFVTPGEWSSAPVMQNASEIGANWYKYSFKAYASQVQGKGVSVIVFNGANDTQRVTIGNTTGTDPVADSGPQITITGTEYYISGAGNGQWSTTKDDISTVALYAMLPVVDKAYLGA